MSMDNKNDFAFLKSSINNEQQQPEYFLESESEAAEDSNKKRSNNPTQDLALILFGLFCCDACGW